MNAFRVCSLVALIVSVAACAEVVPPPPGTGGTNGTGATGATGATGGRGASGGTGAMGGNGATGGSGGSSGMGGSAGSGGTGGMSGGGGSGGMSGAGGDGGSGGMSGAGGTGGVGACLLESDIDAITALYPTSARQVAAQCGENCSGAVGDQQYLACVNPCIQSAIGLSLDCTSCYGNFALCIRFICLSQCSANACIPNCEACPGYQPCGNALNLCAGRDSTDCIPEQ